MPKPKRPVLLSVAILACVVSLVHLLVGWFGSAELQATLDAATGGWAWLDWPILAFFTLMELRTGLFAMRVAAVVLMVGQACLGAYDWLQLRADIDITGASTLQGVWMVAVPISIALILHAERPIISWQWKEPRTNVGSQD